LNDCIYKAYKANNCQSTLDKLQDELDSGRFKDKVNLALYQVAHAGRQAGGAEPRESFQVFVLEYVTFFGMGPECNDYTWSVWPGWWSEQPKLTLELRQKLNDKVRQVNAAIKAAAEDLKGMEWASYMWKESKTPTTATATVNRGPPRT
jgi:hypothetical protein